MQSSWKILVSSFLVNLQAEHLFIQLYLPLNDNTKLKIINISYKYS